MIDDVEAFVSAAQILQERGAYKIYVLATHGLLSADAPRLIEDSAIHEVRNPDSFIHSFITEIYIAPLQGYYSEALPTLAWPKRRVLRLE